MKIEVLKKPTQMKAKNYRDAYEQGLLHGSMHRDELLARITRKNPTLTIHWNEHSAGLWDSHKGYICGITRDNYHPQFTIMIYNTDYDKTLALTTGKQIHNIDANEGKVLARSWRVIFQLLENKGYEIDWRGIK